MPNAVNRLKPKSLVKVEKENENTVIRHRLRVAAQKEKLAATKAESVWQRLSKVRKSMSNEDSLGSGNRSRLTLQAKSSHRLTVQRPSIPKATRKPPVQSTTGNKRHTDMKKSTRKTKLTKPRLVGKQPEQPRSFVLLCKQESVKEILTARSMCNSKTSSEKSERVKQLEMPNPLESPAIQLTCNKYGNQSSDFSITELDSYCLSTEDSFENFEIAPLMQVPTRESVCPSAKITHNIKGLLGHKKYHMPAEDLMVIKDIVKTDARHRQLNKDDSSLFRDILKTQLHEILKQESLVKSVLDQLEAKMEPEKKCSTSVTEDVYTYQDSTSKQKPQVDVIFKNVPTLEKEIIILKALGEKLEATLRRTGSQQNIPTFFDNSSDYVKAQLKYLCLNKTEQNAQIEVRPKGFLHSLDFVKEYQIAHKTIIELRENASRHFYLPADKDKSQLRRTSFKKLKEQPDVLKRHLKPKNSLVRFNVLDQDPVFFNSIMYNIANDRKDALRYDLFSDDSTTQSSHSAFSLRDGGDHILGHRVSYQCLPNKEPLHIEEIGEPCRFTKLESKRSGIQMVKTTEISKVIDTVDTLIRKNVPEVETEIAPIVTPSVEPNVVDLPMATKQAKKLHKKKTICQQAPVVKVPPLVKAPVVKAPVVKTPVTKAAVVKKLVVEKLVVKAPVIKTPVIKTPAVKAPSLSVGVKRRRTRRSVTPMPMKIQVESKNNLFKTVLVGAVQIAVFLILIMAVTYPDIAC